MQDAIPVDPHVVQGLKPLTPTFCTPSPHEGFEPISPATTPKYGGMPVDADNLEELQEAVGWIYNPAVGLGRTQSPIPQLAIRDRAPRPEVMPERRSWHSSQETVPYEPKSPEARVPIEVQVEIQEEGDTSAKESTMGSPEPARRKRRLSASERSASKKSEPEPGPSGVTPKQFKPGGKDIENLQKAVAEARKVPLRALDTPKQKTFHSSVYGQSIQQEKKEKAQGRKELKLGGKGQGKRGRKSVPKKHAGRAWVTTSVAARREGWQDPEVMRALTGEKPPGAISETQTLWCLIVLELKDRRRRRPNRYQTTKWCKPPWGLLSRLIMLGKTLPSLSRRREIRE